MTSHLFVCLFIYLFFIHSFIHSLIHLKYCLFIFRARRREREREGDKHWCVRETAPSVASHTPPSGDLAHNPGTCPAWEWKQWPFGLQAGTQSTEPCQPEGRVIYLKCISEQIKSFLIIYFSPILLCGHNIVEINSTSLHLYFIILLNVELNYGIVVMNSTCTKRLEIKSNSW